MQQRLARAENLSIERFSVGACGLVDPGAREFSIENSRAAPTC
jgi:hypothetical protein